MCPTGCVVGTRVGNCLTLCTVSTPLFKAIPSCMSITYGPWNFCYAQVMMWYEEAALEQKRDAAPLRLISWLTIDLPKQLNALLENLMLRFAQQGHPLIAEVNYIVRQDFPGCAPLATFEKVRDFIVKQIGEWNGDWQPPSLLDLFEGFLRRFSLPRLVHFLDMILPQFSPIHTRWDDPRKSLLRLAWRNLKASSLMKLALLPNNVQRGLAEGHSALVYSESGTLPSGASLHEHGPIQEEEG